jgi:topoisomerase-4 subunit A
MKRLMFETDFGDLAIKGRDAMGNILSKFDIHRIVLKEKGISTLGGRKIWFDTDVLRLNSDARGNFLGEFQGDDQILVIYKNGEYQPYNFDLSNHFYPDMLSIEKYRPGKVISVVYYDAEQTYFYVKRFEIEEISGKRIGFIGENPGNKLVSLTWIRYPRLEIRFGGKNAERGSEIVEVADFIGIKSYKARGKRLTNYEVENIHELEPVIHDEDDMPETEKEADADADDIPFEIERPADDEEDTNQMTLF